MAQGRLFILQSFDQIKTVSRETALIWWSQGGSNSRPPACKAGALPAELWPRLAWAFVREAALLRVRRRSHRLMPAHLLLTRAPCSRTKSQRQTLRFRVQKSSYAALASFYEVASLTLEFCSDWICWDAMCALAHEYHNKFKLDKIGGSGWI
jgi:hypothetical protein